MENYDNIHIMVVEPRGSGGMIHYAYQLCTALSKAGAKVTLVTSDEYEMDNFPHNFTVRKQMKLWSPTETSQTESAWGWVGRAANKSYRSARRVFRGVRLLVEWIRLTSYLVQAKPDVIQFGKIEFPFEAIFLAILKRHGLLLSQVCHEFELREQGNNLLITISNKMYRWVYGSFSILFFHGESNRQRFLELFKAPAETLHLIEHGNEGLFLSVRSKTTSAAQMRERYGIFGNLTPSKGLPDLLKAFSIVHQKESRARLVVVGKPSKFIDMDSLKELIRELDIAQSTILDAQYLPMEDVGSLMEMATVVVYPYLNSTQSGALQVAYTFGKPVIATNVGGLPEAVEDGKSGFIVSPSAPEELSSAIMKLIKNPGLAREIGAYAKLLSETRFSWDMIAMNIVKIYAAVVIKQ
jgi:glycosyltransferase involved in cell wall biosynthesis